MQTYLGDRSKYIGASDVNIIFGVSPFTKRQDLLKDKLGIEKIEFEGNPYTEFGHEYEDTLLDMVENDYGLKLERQKEVRTDELGFPVICHLDGYSEGVVVEAKTTSSSKFEKDWACGCPDYYKPQTHTCAFVSGARRIITVVGERLATTPEDRDDYFDKLCEEGLSEEEAAHKASRYHFKLGRVKAFDDHFNDNYFIDVFEAIEDFISDLTNGFNEVSEKTVKKYLKLKEKKDKFSDELKNLEEEIFKGDKRVAVSKDYEFSRAITYSNRFDVTTFKSKNFAEYAKYYKKMKTNRFSFKERKK